MRKTSLQSAFGDFGNVVRIDARLQCWHYPGCQSSDSQRKFSSKTSELRTNVQGQSRHNLTIMSTSFVCESSIEERNTSGTRGFTDENTLGHEILRFLG